MVLVWTRTGIGLAMASGKLQNDNWVGELTDDQRAGFFRTARGRVQQAGESIVEALASHWLPISACLLFLACGIWTYGWLISLRLLHRL